MKKGWHKEPARHALAARGIRSSPLKSKVPRSIRLYHASSSKNINSIKRLGILPRGRIQNHEAYIDSILTEYGVTRADVPEYIWKYPLDRLMETSKHVYLSADPRVAKGNALASYEAEDMMRRELSCHLGLEYKKPKREISVCEVDVPADLVDGPVPSWMKDAETKWEIVERCNKLIGDLYEDEQDVLRHVFTEVKLDKPIPPEWVKGCSEAKP